MLTAYVSGQEVHMTFQQDVGVWVGDAVPICVTASSSLSVDSEA